MTLDILLVILVVLVPILYVYFGHDIWKHPDEPVDMGCEDCPNYEESIGICIFECERCKQ